MTDTDSSAAHRAIEDAAMEAEHAELLARGTGPTAGLAASEQARVFAEEHDWRDYSSKYYTSPTMPADVAPGSQPAGEFNTSSRTPQPPRDEPLPDAVADNRTGRLPETSPQESRHDPARASTGPVARRPSPRHTLP
jgi:hypothetical protein